MASKYEIKITRRSGGATIVYEDGSNATRVNDYDWQWVENKPRTVKVTLANNTKVPALNILSPSCALWSSGTGALDLGDLVDLSIYPRSSGTKTNVFHGIITELEQGLDGKLLITAKDFLEKYETMKAARTIFSGYHDYGAKDTGTYLSYRTITGLSESDIVTPLEHVGFANADSRAEWTDGTTNDRYSYGIQGVASCPKIAQPYIATQDALLGVTLISLYNNLSGTGSVLKVSLQADNGAGQPDGNDIASTTISKGYTRSWVTEDANLTTGSVPVVLTVGRLYWIVLEETNLESGYYLLVENRDDAGGYPVQHFLRYVSGSWVQVSDHMLNLKVHTLNYQTLEEDSYYFDDANNRVVITGSLSGYTATQSFVAPKRGRVSYYYGSRTLEDLFRAIIRHEGSMADNVSGNCDRTYGVYQTRGKFLGECMRELADVVETSGAWVGYQHTVAHYSSGGLERINVGRRAKPSDASAFTFSTAAGAADGGMRITGATLKKTIRMKHSTVYVIGKGPTGLPVVGVASDRARSDSLYRKTGLVLMEEITDENVTNIRDADAAAWAELGPPGESDVYEGSVTVAGVYPDVMGINTGDLTNYGSGKIVTLTIPEIGMNAVKVKVKGVRVHVSETEIQVSNEDILSRNRIITTRQKADRTEGFQAPTELTTDIVVVGYIDAMVNADPAYMVLADDDGMDLPIPRLAPVRCVRTSGPSGYNTYIYHATFEPGNGVTSSGNPIGEIHLVDGSGNLIANSSLRLYDYSAEPYLSREIYKWRMMRATVKLITKSS